MKKVFFVTAFLITSVVCLLIFLRRPMEFTPAKWPVASLTEKYRMAKSLINSNELIRLNQEQVVKMLGEPNGTSDFEFFYKLNEPLGYKDYLSINFKNNKVLAAYFRD